MSATEIVDRMDLTPGHILTEEECDAIQVVGSLALDLEAIRRRLGIEDDE